MQFFQWFTPHLVVCRKCLLQGYNFLCLFLWENRRISKQGGGFSRREVLVTPIYDGASFLLGVPRRQAGRLRLAYLCVKI